MNQQLRNIFSDQVSVLRDSEVGQFHLTGGAIFIAFQGDRKETLCYPFSQVESALDLIRKQKANFSEETQYKLIADSRNFLDFVSAINQEIPRLDVKKSIDLQTEKHLFIYGESGRVRLEKTGLSGPSLDVDLQKRIRVLIVDDSPVIHKALKLLLGDDPDIEIVGSAFHPNEVEEKIRATNPDVITLDLNMPEENGVELLRRLFPKFPLPFILLTSYTREQGPLVFDALEAGAVDYVHKPGLNELDDLRHLMRAKIKAIGRSGVNSRLSQISSRRDLPKPALNFSSNKVICIGTSTGGPEALRILFSQFPDHIPPVLVVQHIPPVFSKAMADRFNELFSFEVREARDGDVLRKDLVLVAPGGMQMKVVESKGEYFVRVLDDAPVNLHKPSVDYLFDSAAKALGRKAVGVIMTGMGGDGAAGLLKMREAGASTLCQDEASSVVYGMPKVAWEKGAAMRQAALDHLGFEIQKLL